MTRIVSSKAAFEAAKAEADEIGMRLAFVIPLGEGNFRVDFRDASTFTDWSKAGAA